MEANSPPPESSLKHKADALQALVSGPLAAATARLSGRSRGIPTGKDFHFYNNFDEFKAPAREIAAISESSLKGVGASGSLWGSKNPPSFPDDLDDAFDWLVNLNDEFLERFGISMDEFKNLREKEEVNGGKISSMDLDGGFQMVYGKKKKGSMRALEKDGGNPVSSSAAGVKVVSRDKKTMAPRSRVPFHIPSIPRPQDQYSILVNNKNQPFEHVWLEKSEDGSRFIHPLEKLSVLDFLDRNVGEVEPVKPLPLESTPFKLVEGVNELKELASKLQAVNEFAVDLEHNQYRSFQGLTCLMQISTRTEDFIIDTLKLRIHVGPYLREIFKDPSKRKVMHGADRDILWLQRDFGIYVCNLVDTGQASRVLQLERNSLEHLLHYFCGVTANKEYQNADWRLRPLPNEMLKYAREDTHYLLHIYDLMKTKLISSSTDENDLLLEVYKRSIEICMQLYEKELLTDTSYLHIYRLQEADFDSKQLAVVAGLCQWRDNIARAEDESTGYILPNKALLEIAKHMPITAGKLHRLVKSKHPFVERYINDVISIIRSSIANSAAFERTAVQLKKGRLEASLMQDMKAVRFDLVSAAEDPMGSVVGQDDLADGTRNIDAKQNAELAAASMVTMNDCAKPTDSGLSSSPVSVVSKCQQEEKLENMPLSETGCPLKLADMAGTMQKTDYGITEHFQPARKASIASVQILKKPTGAFGALLGNSSSRRKYNADKEGNVEQVKNESKVEQIKSTVALPFHYFSGGENLSEASPEVNLSHRQVENQQHCTGTMKLGEVIPLENEPDNSESAADSMNVDDSMKHREWFPLPKNGSGGFQPESDIAEGLASPLDLASSFEKCFQSINERRTSHQNQRPSQEPEVNYQLKSFDYAAARKNIKFGKAREKERGEDDDGIPTVKDSGELHQGLVSGQSRGEERVKGFQQPRRRQAFPPSGNRSTTYH